jgi:predicted phosphohydrolase
MRLAVTADLHFGLSDRGDAATRELARQAAEAAPDAFVIAGDVGEGEEFVPCLQLFAGLACPRLVLPGNHDLWVRRPSSAASLYLYERRLPALAAGAGFHYLDGSPFLPPEASLAVVGSMNWYDYSFADPALEAEFPGVEAMYRRKLFPRGWHNDGQFVRLGMSDEEFTARLVEQFQAQLAALPPAVERVIVIQHHPPVRELFYPSALTTADQRFWLAYSGNRRMQAAVLADPRVTTILCGHTHAACEATVEGRRCLNIGGDYDWKRLLLLDTDTGAEQSWEFGHTR